MEEKIRPRIVCLSNVFDQHYHDLRGEQVLRCLTTPYRSDLFRCLEMASGREVIVLSSPPKAEERRTMVVSNGDQILYTSAVFLR
jgi:hypothetical protein